MSDKPEPDPLNRFLSYRLTQAHVQIDGIPFDLRKYIFLRELYDEQADHVVIKKAAQLGLTVWAILTVIERMKSMYRRGVLYAFPTDDEVYDFSQSRFERIIKENDSYTGIVSSTDRVVLKKVANAILYFRGMRSRSKLLSIPVDCIVFDEFGEMEPHNVPVAKERLAASDYQHWIKLGHPTIPNANLDLEWQNSDQRHWQIKCDHCGEWTCLEASFPESVVIDDPFNREAHLACDKCRKQIFVQNGQWVAAVPDKKTRGYWMSQLLSPTVPPMDIIDAFEEAQMTGRGLQTFYNLKLGLPYADIDEAIEAATVMELCDSNTLPWTFSEGPSFLGADVGKNTIHICVGERTFGEKSRCQFMEVGTFDELHDIGEKFHVQVGVIDAMAESRSVRKFMDKNPWAWGSWYNMTAKNEPKWDPKKRMVTNSRTETLDASHYAMIHEIVSFPRASGYFEKRVVPQLVNLVRTIVEDEKTGQQRPTWIVRGSKNDHYRHALNYAYLAQSRVSMSRRTRGAVGRMRPFDRNARPATSWMGS